MEPVTPVAPRPVGAVVMAQWWRYVSFVHWAVDPERAARLLPGHLRPDLHGDVTYLGVVALRIERTRLFGLPPVPYLGTFTQVNVRLYAVDDHGRRGVVFLSLDTSRFAPVVIGRTIVGLPYRWSQVNFSTAHQSRPGRVDPGEGDRVTYTCRLGGADQVTRMTLNIGAPLAEPGPLETFLTARWGMHLRGLYLPNEHVPWPLHEARLVTGGDIFAGAAGLPELEGREPVSVLWSPGVYAWLGFPASVEAGQRTEP